MSNRRCEIFDLAMLYSTGDLVQHRAAEISRARSVRDGCKKMRCPRVARILELRGCNNSRRYCRMQRGPPPVSDGISWRSITGLSNWAATAARVCEDNVRWDKDTLAKSNAQLVARVGLVVRRIWPAGGERRPRALSCWVFLPDSPKGGAPPSVARPAHAAIVR